MFGNCQFLNYAFIRPKQETDNFQGLLSVYKNLIQKMLSLLILTKNETYHLLQQILNFQPNDFQNAFLLHWTSWLDKRRIYVQMSLGRLRLKQK